MTHLDNIPQGTGQLSPQFALQQGRYVIIARIGMGGMGAVYRAADARLGGKTVAIKEMSDAGIVDPSQKQQAIDAFRQEAQMLAHLDHANLPKVMDYFTENGKHYIVMEFVEGETLDSYLERQRVGEAQVRMWAAQLFDVLGYLHRQQPPVIFRDLKPDNVMLTPQGRLKLIDFGIARFFKPGKPGDTVAMGTPGYAAPEQHGSDQTDARSDVYSLGVVLHQALTGYDPSLDPFNFPSVRRLNPSVSPQMEQAIAKAIQINRLNRFQSVDEFRAALAAGVTAPGGAPVKTGPAGGQLGKLVALVAGAVVLLLIAFLGGRVMLGRDLAPPVTERLRVSIDNAARLTQIKQFDIDASSLVWTPDSRHLLLATASGVLMVNISEESQTSVITSTSPSLLDVSSDGARLVTGSPDAIHVWSLTDAQAKQVLDLPASSINDLTFSSNGELVAWSSRDESVKVLDIEEGTVEMLPENETDGNARIAFSPDGLLFASSGASNEVRLWNMRGMDPIGVMYDRFAVTQLQFAPSGQLLASASEDGTITMWNVRDLTKAREMLGHLAPVTSITFSPDGRLLASGSRDDTVRLWEVESGLELRILKGHVADVTDAKFSPDGRWIASLGEDNTLRLWHVR